MVPASPFVHPPTHSHAPITLQDQNSLPIRTHKHTHTHTLTPTHSHTFLRRSNHITYEFLFSIQQYVARLSGNIAGLRRYETEDRFSLHTRVLYLNIAALSLSALALPLSGTRKEYLGIPKGFFQVHHFYSFILSEGRNLHFHMMSVSS